MNDIDIETSREVLSQLRAESNLLLNISHHNTIDIEELKDCTLAIDSYVSTLEEMWGEENMNG